MKPASLSNLMPALQSAARWVAVATLSLSAAVATAQVQQIQGTPTNLKSMADRMISYRSQNHMWQTPDGATHVFMNRGALQRGKSLVLFSTYDGGTSWDNTGIFLPGSNGSSTSDGYLEGNRLYMTYDVGANSIRASELSYDSASKRWSLDRTETVFTAVNGAALTPAFASDSQGRQWLAFTHQDKASGNFSVKMMLKVGADDPWVDTGFVFGTPDNLANERSGRPVRTFRGIGMVFTLKTETFWAERADSWALDKAWARAPIYTKEVPSSDPYGTHFSLVTDSDFNIHMASVDGGRLVYSRYLVADKAWATRIMTEDIKATYPQATMIDDTVALVTNAYTNLSVFQSTDSGETFTRTHALTHAAPEEGVDYNRPRVESPSYSSGAMIVLQQYIDGRTRRALYFSVPAVGP